MPDSIKSKILLDAEITNSIMQVIAKRRVEEASSVLSPILFLK